MHALTRTGRSHSSVARELALDRRTVRKYARAHTWQEVMRRPPRKPSALDPYLDYLQQRRDEGQHSAKILHEELQTKGYLGHYQRVKMAVAPPCDEACPWTSHTSDRPPRAKPPAGSPPVLATAARRPTTACLDSSTTAPNSGTPMTWSAGSPPCSTTVTPPPCRAG
ncbi:hypothetical protein WKI68_05705 [Streptomyces sp. MS1.HAVA.3]|uniref:HTH IS21-type domain-containing protein n=1 Tax=Streptomyces caledonius TaxID=3134107 RepID=A0ABU8TZP0_9ACTN